MRAAVLMLDGGEATLAALRVPAEDVARIKLAGANDRTGVLLHGVCLEWRGGVRGLCEQME